jgi:hypothetical protein
LVAGAAGRWPARRCAICCGSRKWSSLAEQLIWINAEPVPEPYFRTLPIRLCGPLRGPEYARHRYSKCTL